MTFRHHRIRVGDETMGGAVDSIFPGTGKVAAKGLEELTPALPEIPAAPLSPDNDPAAQAKIAEAAQREREEESRRRGRASTVLAGEDAGSLSTAKRSLLGA